MLDISKKIDKFNLEILKKIKEAADKLNIKFFIVGATVRDMILNYVYDIKVYRKTNDIDLAVRVKNWDKYNLLINEIEKTGFTKSENILHRYFYRGMMIDFIPFGGISTKDETIKWSNDKDEKEMNVIGFADAFLNTEDIVIQTDPDIIIKSASVESLAMLKIFAWHDRAIDVRIKDARDLYLIMSKYLQAGNESRLFEEHLDIVEEATDYELAGARLLGGDISNIASDKVRERIHNILKDDKQSMLAIEMAQFEGLTYKRDETEKVCLLLVGNLRIGLRDKR
ncbi:MAG: nucleotidyl transferase AbiEii/AbiGii toxin family protein [Ignavibacteriaceae bacterium]|nr:nucleotidyl transferase AbiEii/AbiGii toxin family protein [Ignavibacteriaceae bacterium]